MINTKIALRAEARRAGQKKQPFKLLCKECGQQYEHLRQTVYCGNRCQNLARSRSSRFIRTGLEPLTLFDIHHQTLKKLLRRMKIGCSRCGWNLAPCDIHHINGKKIPDPNNHQNLSYLCPNCHRLYHSGIITKNELIPFAEQIGDSWRKFLFTEMRA